MTKPTLNLNEPFKTRSGHKVRLISTEGAPPYVLVGYVEQSDHIRTWRADGSYIVAPGHHELDLQNAAPASIISYVNIYKGGFSFYYTRDEADRNAADNRLGCQRVVLTPGTWDD